MSHYKHLPSITHHTEWQIEYFVIRAPSLIKTLYALPVYTPPEHTKADHLKTSMLFSN